jgi:hypothetical protein
MLIKDPVLPARPFNPFGELFVREEKLSMKIEQQQDWLGQEQGEVGAKTMGQSDFC